MEKSKPNDICPHLNCLVAHAGPCTCDMKRWCSECREGFAGKPVDTFMEKSKPKHHYGTVKTPERQGWRERLANVKCCDVHQLGWDAKSPELIAFIEAELNAALDGLVPKDGENTHSVYTYCWDCLSQGINAPSNTTCGDCGSKNTSEYWPDCRSETLRRIEERKREMGIL